MSGERGGEVLGQFCRRPAARAQSGDPVHAGLYAAMRRAPSLSRIVRALAALLAVALPVVPALGQGPALEGPPLGVRVTLPNDIVVLVAQRPTLPIATVRVPVGA